MHVSPSLHLPVRTAFVQQLLITSRDRITYRECPVSFSGSRLLPTMNLNLGAFLYGFANSHSLSQDFEKCSSLTLMLLEK